jgi:Spy/CpxP family protein refolding chaperone
MLKRTLLPLALMGVLLIAGGYAVAQKRMGMDQTGHLDRLKEHLSLTDAQVTQVQAIFKAHHEAAQPLFTEMRTNHEALKTALNAPEPNATDVGKLVIADNALKAKMQALSDKLKTDIGAILTPEQKAKFDAQKSFRGRGQRFRRG